MASSKTQSKTKAMEDKTIDRKKSIKETQAKTEACSAKSMKEKSCGCGKSKSTKK